MNSPPFFRSPAPRYGLAVAAMLAAVALRWAFVPVMGLNIPYLTIFPATMWVAVTLGARPALVVTALGVLLAEYYFVLPKGIEWDLGFAIRSVILMLTSLYVGWVSEKLRAARARADAETAAARAAEQALRRQAQLIDPVRAELIAQEMQRAVRERDGIRDHPEPGGTVQSASALVRWGVRMAGATAILIGGFHLVAWLGGFAAQWAALSGQIILKTNMALGQVLAGVSLLLASPGSASRTRRIAGSALALIVLAIGALTLNEHLFHYDLGIDQLLAREAPGARATVSPNRMGMVGSSSLTLLGAGLLALALGRRAVAPVLGLAVCVVNLVPAVGFLCGISRFYSQPLTGIAWPTVLVLSVLGLGLMVAQRDSGPMVLLLRDDPGGTLLRRLLPAALLVPLALGFLRMEGERHALYDAATGTGGMTIAVIVLLSALMFWAARALSRADANRRQAETQLRNQAELMDHASEALIVREPGGVIRSWNRGAEALYGWSAAEALGQRIHVMLRTEGADAAEIDAQLQQTGRWEGELLHTTRDGRRITVESRKTASRVGGGQVFILESNRDVTLRKHADEQLRASEEHLSRLNAELQAANASLVESRSAALNLMDDAVAARRQAEQGRAALEASEQRMQQALRVSHSFTFEWQPATDRVLRSASCEPILDLAGEEACHDTGQQFFQRVHPDDRARFVQMLGKLTPAADTYTTEYRVLRGDGSAVVLEETARATFDAAGKLDRLVGVSTDITERRRAEEALAESEERYRDLVELSPDAVLVQRDDCYQFANSAASRLFGAERPEQLIGRNLFEFVPPPDRLVTGERLWRLDEGLDRELPEHECRILRVDGQLADVEARMASIVFQGKPAVLTIFRDITERKRAERARRESESFYRQTLESIPGMVFTTRPDGYCDYQSQQWVEFTGIPLSEHLGDGWNKLLHPDDRPRAFAAWRDAVEGRAPYDLEYRVRRHDGEYEWFKVRGRPIRDAAGQIVRWFGTALNIEELKRTEEHLKASLREKEVLLQEIHHRVKNNLQVISSLINLQADALNQPALRASLEDVRDRVRTMALVHEKLYQSGDLARLNFADYAASLLHYLWRAHGDAAAKVRLNLATEAVTLPVGMAVPCGLILNELASNALKHGFQGRPEGEVIVGLAHDAATNRVCLRVSDNGTGLPAGWDWRQSRSLGLRLVQMLAQQIGGVVEVASEPGTEFRVTFPGPEGV